MSSETGTERCQRVQLSGLSIDLSVDKIRLLGEKVICGLVDKNLSNSKNLSYGKDSLKSVNKSVKSVKYLSVTKR